MKSFIRESKPQVEKRRSFVNYLVRGSIFIILKKVFVKLYLKQFYFINPNAKFGVQSRFSNPPKNSLIWWSTHLQFASVLVQVILLTADKLNVTKSKEGALEIIKTCSTQVSVSCSLFHERPFSSWTKCSNSSESCELCVEINRCHKKFAHDLFELRCLKRFPS